MSYRLSVPALALALASAPALAHPPAAAPAASASSDGLIRHYVRSNRDGSVPEHVVHFRPSRTDVAVYKWVEKCETAAYVTAQLDPGSLEPIGLDAGKVARDGSQARFGRIDFDPATRRASAWADLPPGRMADDAILPAGRNWVLFDYDLGDLNAWFQETRPAHDFEFAFGLIWPERADFFTHLADVRAVHSGLEARGGRDLRRFDLVLGGPAFGEGSIYLDPDSGAIVEAMLTVPNHPGMRDFKLVLERTEPGGAAAWEALLKAHHAGCPA